MRSRSSSANRSTSAFLRAVKSVNSLMLAIRPMAIAESSRPSLDESLDRRRELENITLRYFYTNLSAKSCVSFPFVGTGNLIEMLNPFPILGNAFLFLVPGIATWVRFLRNRIRDLNSRS
jgi:hypothetical protein